MTFLSSDLVQIKGRDHADYGVVRLRDQAFDAVQELWRKRKAAGETQKMLADRIGRDPAWVSKNLRAPGNWTLRTIGELVQALEGEIEIRVSGLEEPIGQPENFDAYDQYIQRKLPVNFVGSISVQNPITAKISVNQGCSYEIKVSEPMWSLPAGVNI